ncbi:hypothetical protein [Actinomycetospora sp. CA-053990]|uniref:hypothetical protein n=1 Tax=Actinomycetospora sp. CA-053990 TaxID=3239891 RepID=UPI003D908D19
MTVVCVILAAGFVAAGVVVALRGGTGARVGLLLGAGLVAAAVGLATRPAPRGVGPRLVERGDRTPRWALVAGYGRLRSCAGGLAALGVALVPVGLLLDGLRSGAASAMAEGAAGTVVVGAVAGALLARGLAHREVALTEEAVEIGAGRLRVVLPWGQVRGVRSRGPEHADGRPRRIALDVTAPGPSSRLLDRLAAAPSGGPGGARTLVLPTAGLDVDPALLLAALDHHLELPGERVHLADHERESGDCGER